MNVFLLYFIHSAKYNLYQNINDIVQITVYANC